MSSEEFFNVFKWFFPLFIALGVLVAVLLIKRVSFIGRSSGYMRVRWWITSVIFVAVGIMTIVLWIVGI